MGRVRGVADDTFTELLQTESRGFKDIVIFENVTESYQNLPQKVRACAFVLCLCFNLCACALVYKYACGVAHESFTQTEPRGFKDIVITRACAFI